MKAPDKIYMLPEELDEKSEWITKPYEDRDVAYIREDFLLEWASEMEKCSQLSAPLLVHELVKKINSL